MIEIVDGPWDGLEIPDEQGGGTIPAARRAGDECLLVGEAVRWTAPEDEKLVLVPIRWDAVRNRWLYRIEPAVKG